MRLEALKIMPYRKGSTIAALTAWKVIPLFVEEGEDHESVLSELPRHYDAPRADCTILNRSSSGEAFPAIKSERIRNSLLRKLQSGDAIERLVVVPSVVVALHLIQDANSSGEKQALLDLDLDCIQERRRFTASDQEEVSREFGKHLLVKQCWEMIREKIEWKVWLQLLGIVARSIWLVESDHPLLEYAARQVPHLDEKELQAVVDALHLPIQNRTKSPLVVQKLIQDNIQNHPRNRLHAILFSSPIINHQEVDPLFLHPHSCLPTAQLGLLENGQVGVIALYDIENYHSVTISCIRDHDTCSVEERDTALQLKLGHSCTCLKCRYEMADCCSSVIPIAEDATVLARHYMSTGDLPRAKHLYAQALHRATSTSTELALDICHVLGAIELSDKNFLKAQRIWKQSAADFPTLEHAGIELQMEKMKAYEYFTRRPRQEKQFSGSVAGRSMPMDTESPVPGALVARVIDEATCQRVIDLAEKHGEWTQQRHYAVPTVDVPVHTVPELLEWFQHEFMSRVMLDILGRQFGKKRDCFFVHDAFCVRYTAGSPSNHLPIHTDESTHSFVLALNDDFEGGGTYFFDGDTIVRPPKGCSLSFCGDLLHGGEAVTRGVRYILAVFLYYDDNETVPQTTELLKRTSSSQVSRVFRESKKKRLETFSFGFSME